jgi:hypothetical protein
LNHAVRESPANVHGTPASQCLARGSNQRRTAGCPGIRPQPAEIAGLHQGVFDCLSVCLSVSLYVLSVCLCVCLRAPVLYRGCPVRMCYSLVYFRARPCGSVSTIAEARMEARTASFPLTIHSNLEYSVSSLYSPPPPLLPSSPTISRPVAKLGRRRRRCNNRSSTSAGSWPLF